MKKKFLSAIAIISIGLSSLSVSRADEPKLDTWDCSVAREQQVSNEHLTLNLNFCDQMILADGREKPVGKKFDIEPYVKSANRWLEVIKGVNGKAHHTISIRVFVGPLDADTNGFAGMERYSMAT